jgi:hypothetical protein
VILRDPKELDLVRLLKDLEGWPAGTEGTVVSEWPGGSLIEINPEPDEDDFRGITPEDEANGVEGDSLFDYLVSAYHHEVEIVVPYAPRHA